MSLLGINIDITPESGHKVGCKQRNKQDQKKQIAIRYIKDLENDAPRSEYRVITKYELKE